MVRTDPFWVYVEGINDGCTKCKFCEHIYTSGTSVSRIKYHLSGLRRAGVKICDKVPGDVRKAARAAVDGPPRKKLKTVASSINNEADNITIPASLTGQNSEAENGMTDRSHGRALGDLIAQVIELKKENSQTLTNIQATTQRYLNLEAENSILRAQMNELSARLESLNEIHNFMDTTRRSNLDLLHTSDDCFMNPFNSIYLNQPIMASPDLFQY